MVPVKAALPVVLAIAMLAGAMPIAALPTPGICGADTADVRGRYFPEPLECTDYIGYFEGADTLRALSEDFPDRVELYVVAQSYGWPVADGSLEPNDVFLVEVTNENSELAYDEKIQLLFMCSIHGNEKGGREGCMRVIEDFARNMGMVADDPELASLLDYMVLIFSFPNTDGWSHDEPDYFPYSPNTLYTRQNGHGTDLNRQWPSMGFMEQDQSHKTLAEPETDGSANFMQERYQNIVYASDIHGMLNPADGPDMFQPTCAIPNDPTCAPVYATEFQQWLENDDKGHFLLSLLPAGQLDQLEQIQMTRLSELLRERLEDACAGSAAASWCQAPSLGLWGGSYNHWGTVWETIGYQVSGGSHDWMLSDMGLNAPSVSFEMSYNHIVCDGVYPGCGEFMNEFHVNTVRVIVATFMEAAKIDFQASVEVNAHRTAYVYNPKAWTNQQPDGTLTPSGGWADENPADDRWDVNNNVFVASTNDYLRDLSHYVRDGDQPAVFDELTADALTADRLANYDTLVVSASTIEQVEAQNKVGVIRDWVNGGGNLVLTDGSLRLAALLGVVEETAVRQETGYVGNTFVFEEGHPLAREAIGYSRQTYEPVPIGYPQGGSPIWTIDSDAVRAAGGDVVGVAQTIDAQATFDSPNADFGEIPFGAGQIRFLGALLPDPSNEQYHPYGLTSWGVTYAGNHYFFNLLDFTQVFEAPPRVLENLGTSRPIQETEPGEGGEPQGEDSPGFGLAFVAIAAVVGALILRRRVK